MALVRDIELHCRIERGHAFRLGRQKSTQECSSATICSGYQRPSKLRLALQCLTFRCQVASVYCAPDLGRGEAGGVSRRAFLSDQSLTGFANETPFQVMLGPSSYSCTYVLQVHGLAGGHD